MTALSAARSQDLAARVCCITCAKAEFASATKFGRSICWFHKKVPLNGKSGREKPLPSPLSRRDLRDLSSKSPAWSHKHAPKQALKREGFVNFQQKQLSPRQGLASEERFRNDLANNTHIDRPHAHGYTQFEGEYHLYQEEKKLH